MSEWRLQTSANAPGNIFLRGADWPLKALRSLMFSIPFGGGTIPICPPSRPRPLDCTGAGTPRRRLPLIAFLFLRQQNDPGECVNWPLWRWEKKANNNSRGGGGDFNVGNLVSGVSCRSRRRHTSLPCVWVRVWDWRSSRMGGPSRLGLRRVCRGVWAPFVSGERGLCSLNQGGGPNRLSL